MKKLAIVITHPIQYNAPWFKLLTERGIINIKVFYTWSQAQSGAKYDPDFKKVIEWDLPLLEGYDYEFVPNMAKEPGSHHFKGIDAPSLNQSIEKWGADAVLVFGWAFKTHLACLRYFKNKIPVLFRGDSTLLDEKKGLKTILRRLFLTWVYKHIDVALYTGTANKNYFKVHRVKEKQLVKAFHAVDNDRFSLDSKEHQQLAVQLREEVLIKPTDFVVLFAGKFEEKKNPLFLVELAKHIQDSQIIFLFVGNGNLEEQLKEAASKDVRIKLLSFQNQSRMPAVYAMSNVYILPSKGPGETWGLAANEAMASGLPVLLSAKTGGAIDLIRENGLLFKLDEIEKTKEYILGLKENPSSYQQAKEASLEQIKKFSFSELALAIEFAAKL